MLLALGNPSMIVRQGVNVLRHKAGKTVGHRPPVIHLTVHPIRRLIKAVGPATGDHGHVDDASIRRCLSQPLDPFLRRHFPLEQRHWRRQPIDGHDQNNQALRPPDGGPTKPVPRPRATRQIAAPARQNATNYARTQTLHNTSAATRTERSTGASRRGPKDSNTQPNAAPRQNNAQRR